jgi:hypothetical protein
MDREKIEIAKGSIAPTQRTLWSSAIEKLEEAEVGLLQMGQANDRIGFEQGWTRIVDSIAEFWTSFFNEGKHGFSNFQPWAGAIEVNWKRDELLMYIYQARHQSQHGGFVFDWNEGSLQITPCFSGHIKNLSIFGDGTFSIGATALPGAQAKAVVRFEGGHANFPTIHNVREMREYAPPKVHLGKEYGEIKPVLSARLAIDYYSTTLSEAFSKFDQGNKNVRQIDSQ